LEKSEPKDPADEVSELDDEEDEKEEEKVPTPNPDLKVPEEKEEAGASSK
jgi:hypothetical protein